MSPRRTLTDSEVNKGAINELIPYRRTSARSPCEDSREIPADPPGFGPNARPRPGSKVFVPNIGEAENRNAYDRSADAEIFQT